MRLMRQGHLFGRETKRDARTRRERGRARTNARAAARWVYPRVDERARVRLAVGSFPRLLSLARRWRSGERLPLVSGEREKEPFVRAFLSAGKKILGATCDACEALSPVRKISSSDLASRQKPKQTVVTVVSASRARAARDGGRRGGCPAPRAGQEGAGEAGESEERSLEDRGRCAFGEGEARAIVREGEPFFLGRSEARATETREGKR